MARHAQKPAPDQDQRDAIVAERDRNVLVDASAGTGKTAILVDRLVEMVAPIGSHPPVPIDRIAAITFTRKAAGELRLRIREQLLEKLGHAAHGSERVTWLRNAVAGLDTAYVGTIHSFADRLLRLRPVDAKLSPSYEIAEDDEILVHETFEVLLQAVESGTLAAELVGSRVAGLADEATRTILDALAAGMKPESTETEYKIYYGLSSLVEGFIRQRDLRPPEMPPAPFDKATFEAVVDEFGREAVGLRGGSAGADWIVRTVKELRRLCQADDPVTIFREMKLQLKRIPRDGASLRDICAGDKETHRVWKIYNDGTKQRPCALKDDLQAPLHRWMATRLVRLFPVVEAIYERIKKRHRQLDQLDLLVKLRDLLVDNLRARGDYQRMFDHVFVDEFQDTDPLQAEIVLFLCEREPRAKCWQDVTLSDGKLTVVGDPKQSIYRFRRADVAMYDDVRRIIAKGSPLDGTLSANFRSVPSLIEWLNNRFERVLGVSPDGKPFDPATGQVFQQDLEAGRGGKPGRPVHVLSFDFGSDNKTGVDGYRELEGRALARYLRTLVESREVHIVDPLDSQPRPVRYGDVAVLAVSTYKLSLLFPRFDEEGIPYASRGGKLFLEDALHRQFLLGLRAIADREDGVAEAALLRPPFFAVDPLDLLLERAATASDKPAPNELALRAREARELVQDLRRRRFDRPPGATARDLLDLTAFARTVAMGANGTQRLARLRELCLYLEQLAANDGLDYDAATSKMRAWVDDPIQLDPPHPVGTEAVQILTVHQAKGLEFPVVAIWDGKGQWNQRPESGPWRVDRDGKSWMMDLAEFHWEESNGIGIQEKEKKYLDAERRRVVYVAATRARDLLIIPKAGEVAPGRFICGDLLAGAPAHLVDELEPYLEGGEPAWAKRSVPVQSKPSDTAVVEQDVTNWWKAACENAAQPRFRPASVSGETHLTGTEDAEGAVKAEPRKPHPGRFGNVFGTTVHEAIGLVLREPALSAPEAVARASRFTGLSERLEEAAADVCRALETLRSEGFLGPLGPSLQLEYPVAAGADGGRLVGGYIDLVSATDDRVDVIDFKTDQPPSGPVGATYPGYVSQVRKYGRLCETSGAFGNRALRCGLLYTADGILRWV